MLRYLLVLLMTLALLQPLCAGAATLTFVAGPNGTLSGTTTQTVATGGTSSAVTAVPSAGYYLVNWTGTGGFVATTANPLTVRNVTTDQTITANFAFGSFDLIAHGLSNAVAVKAGASHSMVLKKDGTVTAWGGGDGQSPAPAGLSQVLAIGAGVYHSLAVKSDHTVAAWGLYPNGTAAGSAAAAVPAGLSGVTAVTGGYSFSVALKSDGTVVGWGDNSYGQISVPAGLTGVTAIAAGHYHTVALKSNGTVVAWGRNYEGQCTVPTGLSGVIAVDAKGNHTVALKSDGTVVCWGANEFGQSKVPAGLAGVKAIAAGGYHTVALKTDGTIVAWGDDEYGQCTTYPAGLVGVTAIAAGVVHTLAMKGDIAVVGWGRNISTQCNVPASVYQPLANGLVSCSPSTVYYGGSSVCTVTANPGGRVTTLAANGVNKLTSLVNNSFTLSNIRAFQTVTAVFTGTGAPTVSITSPTTGASYSAPATITIAASATGGSGATVTKVEFYSGATIIGTDTTSPYSISWSNIVAGTYSLTAKVTDSTGATATSAAVAVTVGTVPGDGSLPPGWTSGDVGTVGIAGSAGFLNGVFTLKGAGANIGGYADAFRYAYQSMTGNGEIVARVTSLQNTNTAARAGVMIRQGLTANAANVMMALTPSSAGFSYRTYAGGYTGTVASAGKTAPYWVKVARGGNTFTGYVSADGVNWVRVGSATISMAATVYVGLAVNSHDSTKLCSTTMDNVKVTAIPPPTVSITAPASAATFTAPATISITANAQAAAGLTIRQVAFYAGATLIGTKTTAPYTVTWSSVKAGGYSLTAKATDSLGVITTSAPVTISVTAPPPPTVSITAPASGASFAAPASISISANATAAPGLSIRQVSFYIGATLIGTKTTPPYTVTRTNVLAGNYSLTARALDSLGVTTTSAPVTISVFTSGARFVYDTFTASTTTALETHVGELGATWTKLYGSNVGYIDPVNDGIYSTVDVSYRASGVPPTPDYSVLATVRAFSIVSNTNMGVSGRVDKSSNSRYVAYFAHGVGWRLIKIISGVETVFGVYTPTGIDLVNGTNYTVELRMKGSTISMYVNGILGVSVTDTSLTAAGFAGVELHGAGPGAAYELLDFQARAN